MSTATIDTATEIFEVDLDELNIDQPRGFCAAYRISDDTIVMVVADETGACDLDDPSRDHSGEDAWEWISFANGRERDAWAAEHGREPNLVWIERYEHGLVNYAPIGEASVIDRQWDVASGVAVIRFKKDLWPDETDLMVVARGICTEYTNWCNGDAYGLVRYQRRLPVDAPHSPVLVPDEFTVETWVEAHSCWGFLGSENAIASAKAGDV